MSTVGADSAMFSANSNRKFISRKSSQAGATVNTTISKEERFTAYKTLAPGPGAYEFKTVFPSGPKHHIQSKSKFDSLIGTKVHQSISPGPAMYRISRNVGGTH